MLFNPKWSRKELTLENALLWMEAQDPDKEYNYADCAICACGQWLRASGVDERAIQSYSGFWTNNPAIKTVNRAAHFRPWTFGALAQRLRACVS